MSLCVLTPSYAVDYELCADMHRSVLQFTPPDVAHHIVVPDRDVELFSGLAGERCTIWSERAVLPPRIRQTPRLDRVIRKVGRLPQSARVAAVNVRRPFPPIRGWILQQVLKISMTTQLQTDLVLLMDSDVELVRPVKEEMFVEDGRTVLYRRPDAVHADMKEHVRWHEEAWQLLGIPAQGIPQPDYVSSFMVWDREVVAALQQRISTIAGRPWLDVLASRLHLSEWTLYGVFAEQIYAEQIRRDGGTLPVTDTSRCLEHWGTTPLTAQGAEDFANSLASSDLAMMISAKSRTPLPVRHRATEIVAARASLI